MEKFDVCVLQIRELGNRNYVVHAEWRLGLVVFGVRRGGDIS